MSWVRNIAVLLLAGMATPVFANNLFSSFNDGNICFIRFHTIPGGCIGTLQRNVTYEIRYLDFENQHRVHGKICNKGDHQSVAKPAPENKSGNKLIINIWGEHFDVSSDGKITSAKHPGASGKLLCTAG